MDLHGLDHRILLDRRLDQLDHPLDLHLVTHLALSSNLAVTHLLLQKDLIQSHLHRLALHRPARHRLTTTLPLRRQSRRHALAATTKDDSDAEQGYPRSALDPLNHWR